MAKREQDLVKAQEPEVEGRTKQEYQSPELIEWGTILELTQSGQAGTQDLPTAGGTGVT
jgi:hypothetical protein